MSELRNMRLLDLFLFFCAKNFVIVAVAVTVYTLGMVFFCVLSISLFFRFFSSMWVYERRAWVSATCLSALQSRCFSVVVFHWFCSAFDFVGPISSDHLLVPFFLTLAALRMGNGEWPIVWYFQQLKTRISWRQFRLKIQRNLSIVSYSHANENKTKRRKTSVNKINLG